MPAVHIEKAVEPMVNPPVIGIAATTAPIRFQRYNVEAVFCPTTYVDAVLAAGGIPLLIPPLEVSTTGGGMSERTALTVVLDHLDGVIVAGGDDVDPSLFGGLRKATTTDHQLRRDLAEKHLVEMALERDLPLLGVCRGMQVMNVATGGTLVDDLAPGQPEVAHQSADGGFTRHLVSAAEGSLAHACMTHGQDVVPTLHHQAVATLGSRLVATAWAEDGVIEAVEDPTRRFALGVQWHPERDTSSQVFRALIDAVQQPH